MKKLLALVLALVMSMSLVTISNAAFSDADKISHDEAVDVLNTLGVINGMPDGSFAPAGNVTRAEMAKMISIIMLGDVDASAFVGTATGLTDIKGHWAEGYIQYCYSQGIIAGRGDGTFAPNANVTAVEAAKMLLGAIGYNATVQGYTGADWAINVTRDAQLSGFYTDLKGLSSNKALTRDEAAQMIYNAVVADLIEKTPVLNVTTGTLQYEYRANSSKSLLTETFKAVKVIGEVIDNEFMSGSGMKGKTTVRVSNFDENKTYANGDTTFKITTGAAELGMSVTLYVKPYNANKSNADKATVLGSVYVNDNNAVYTTGDQIKADKIEKKLKDQGLKLDLTNGAFYMNNYAWQNGGSKVVFTYATLAALTGNGIKVSFVDVDGDGYIDNVLVLEKAFGKVSSVSTKGDGLLNIAKIGSKGASVYENEANDNVADFAKLGLAKNDYVSYYYVSGSEMYYVEKVEGKKVDVTATIGAVGNDGGKFVADTTYKLSKLAGGDLSAASGTQETLPTSVEPGKSAVVYLDDYGYVIYVTEVDTTTAYLMIEQAKAGSWNDTVEAKVILSDGTAATINVAKVGTTKVDRTSAATIVGNLNDAQYGASDASKVRIYSYTVNSDGKYELTEQSTLRKTYTSGTGTNAVVTKNNPTIAVEGGTLYADNSTPFVIKVNSDITAYTGINTVPTRNDNGAAVSLFAVKKSSGSFADIVFVIGGTGATSESNYIYFLNRYPTVTVDAKGNSVYTYDVVRDGEVTTVLAESATVVTKAGLYKVTFTGDKATSVSAAFEAARLVPLAYAAVSSSSTNEGVINGYAYNDNTKFFVIKDNKATEADASTIITEGKDRDVIAIILGGTNEPTVAKYVFIDRDGTLTVGAPAAVAAGSNNAAVKNLPDGAYVPADKSFVDNQNDVAGNAADNRIFKFNAPTQQDYTLTVKNSTGTEVYTETGSNMTVGAHFFYITLKAATAGSQNAGTGTYKAADFAAGTYSYTIIGADGYVRLVGNFTV